MTDLPNALAKRPAGPQALARVEVERRVVFVPEWSQLAFLAGPPLLFAGMGLSVLGLAAMILPGMPEREGRKRLRQAIDPSRGRPPGEVLAALREVAGLRWLTSGVRADTLGWLALGHIEQGELTPALEALRDPVFERRWRPRRAAAGMFGEGIRAIVGRLFPEAGWPIVPSDALVDDPRRLPGQLQLVVIRAVLRLLEAIDAGDPGVVSTRWAELPQQPLAPLPVLMMLVRAEAARVQPSLGLDLPVRIRTLAPAGRALVLQHPAAQRDEGPSSYRMPAPMPVEPSTSLAVPSSMESIRIFGFGGREGLTMVLLAAILGIGMGWLALLTSIVAWTVLSRLVGFPSPLKRRDRLQPLGTLGIYGPWGRELSYMRARSHSRGLRAAKLAPFDRDHLMLMLGVHQAEQALVAGDHAAARDAIGWWLGNLSPAGLRTLDPVGLAAALLRLAGLLGFDEALALLERLPSRRRSGVPRSGHGDAPRAMAMARALVHARRDRWDLALTHATEALEHRRVKWNLIDFSFYDWLLVELEARGHPLSRRELGVPRPPYHAPLIEMLNRP
ncbi:hypothetical protein [Paraliomyxa miuraensis]|uniref:hypothetical protein n=1 Tax=Paraliomyxa miuraensis TaxID=376150 RepID=UPI00224D1CAB|nr:hypothetical protein [Paraliomyxa miuraensis]MCX4248104.1 hypothetical protein [Paraliomyxa miuraensis]